MESIAHFMIYPLQVVVFHGHAELPEVIVYVNPVSGMTRLYPSTDNGTYLIYSYLIYKNISPGRLSDHPSSSFDKTNLPAEHLHIPSTGWRLAMAHGFPPAAQPRSTQWQSAPAGRSCAGGLDGLGWRNKGGWGCETNHFMGIYRGYNGRMI